MPELPPDANRSKWRTATGLKHKNPIAANHKKRLVNFCSKHPGGYQKIPNEFSITKPHSKFNIFKIAKVPTGVLFYLP